MQIQHLGGQLRKKKPRFFFSLNSIEIAWIGRLLMKRKTFQLLGTFSESLKCKSCSKKILKKTANTSKQAIGALIMKQK